MFKKFPYPSGFFDATYCFQAIYHGTLENILFTLSEMKRVTKKGGLVFLTFLPYEANYYDKKSKKHFIYVYSGKKGVLKKSYMRQIPTQPHLFYFLGGWEPRVPHYFSSKEELKCMLNQFFREVKLKKVRKKDSDKWFFWLASCKV